MRTLVVYFSLEGSTEKVANMIAQETGADMVKLETVKHMTQNGPLKFLSHGRRVVMKEKTALKNGKMDLAKYDRIFIGSPVWAGGLSSPVYSLLCDNDFSGKKVYLFACQMGETSNIFDLMRGNLKGAEVLGNMNFSMVKKQEDTQLKERIHNFCAAI